MKHKNNWLHKKWLKEASKEEIEAEGKEKNKIIMFVAVIYIAIFVATTAVLSSQLVELQDEAISKEFALSVGEELCMALTETSFVNMEAAGSGHFRLSCQAGDFIINNKYTESYYDE